MWFIIYHTMSVDLNTLNPTLKTTESDLMKANIAETTTTTTTIGCKRKAGTEDPTTDAVNEDADKFNIFSEDSKRMLSARVTRCKCEGWRICGPCDKKYPHPSRETDDKTPPVLCKRDCEEDSNCTDEYSGIRVLPCTVCKCLTDDGDVDSDWDKMDCEERENLICEEGICPGCLGECCEEICAICNSHNDV